MTNNFIIEAIKLLKPNCAFSIENLDYNTLIWHNSNSSLAPSKEEVFAKAEQLKFEYDAKEYQRKRAAEYPSIQEQMDMQYWDSVNGTTTWQNAIDAVKAKYPKPEVV